MGLVFSIIYEVEVVESDIPQLTKSWRGKIQDAINKKLTTNPETFGKPLRKSLKGYRRLRVGDYRVVFRIEGEVVIIFAIIHRSGVYPKATKRL